MHLIEWNLFVRKTAKLLGFSLAVCVLSMLMSCVMQWPFAGEGHHPSATPAVQAAPEAVTLTPQEKINIAIYKQASPTVVNISSVVYAVDVFSNVLFLVFVVVFMGVDAAGFSSSALNWLRRLIVRSWRCWGHRPAPRRRCSSPSACWRNASRTN